MISFFYAWHLKTAIYGINDNRADRQLPVMSPRLIVVAGAKETFPRSTFRLFVEISLMSNERIYDIIMCKTLTIPAENLSRYESRSICKLSRKAQFRSRDITFRIYASHVYMYAKIRRAFCILNRFRKDVDIHTYCNSRCRSNYVGISAMQYGLRILLVILRWNSFPKIMSTFRKFTNNIFSWCFPWILDISNFWCNQWLINK